jgi:HlyD family secretion protein
MRKGLIVTLVVVSLVVVAVVLSVVIRPKAVPPKTVGLEKRTIQESVTAVGSIVPKHIITVRSALDGIVTKMYKDIGSSVKKGDSLALVGPNVAPVTLAQAISQVSAQEAKVLGDQKLVANDEMLIKNKLASTNYSTYISDLSALHQDLATLQYYKQNLGLTQYGKAEIAGQLEEGQVVSPIEGYILQRNVDVGDSIISVSSNQAATNLFTIADMNEMVFKGSVDELDADKLKVGMKAVVEVGPLGGEKVQGTLNALGLQSNQENEKFSSTNTSLNTNSPFNVGFQVEVGNLVSDKKELLRSGFSATTTFVVHEYKDVDTLPQSAVHFSETETYVMVYEGPKMPSKKITVKTGGSDSSYVQILSGLKPGDKVLMTTSEESNDS